MVIGYEVVLNGQSCKSLNQLNIKIFPEKHIELNIIGIYTMYKFENVEHWMQGCYI